jgi:protease II
MTITYESVYYADRRQADPPAALRAQAEANTEYLLQTRQHRFVTSTNAFGTFSLTRADHVPSSQGWIITYTPNAAEGGRS